MPAQGLSRYTWCSDGLSHYTTVERERLMEPLQEERRQRQPYETRTHEAPRAAERSLLGLAWNSSPLEQLPENRSGQEYEAEVAKYLGNIEQRWTTFILQLVPYFVTPLTFSARNLAGKDYQQLQVSVHVEGEASAAVDKTDVEDVQDFERLLLKAPRLWGPRMRNFGTPYTSLTLPQLYTPRPGPRTQIDNDGSFTLTFVPVDLRPHASEVLEHDIAVLIPNDRDGAVALEWSATATNIGDVRSGTIELDYLGTPVDVFRELLRTLTETDAQRQMPTGKRFAPGPPLNERGNRVPRRNHD